MKKTEHTVLISCHAATIFASIHRTIILKYKNAMLPFFVKCYNLYCGRCTNLHSTQSSSVFSYIDKGILLETKTRVECMCHYIRGNRVTYFSYVTLVNGVFLVCHACFFPDVLNQVTI